MENVLKDFSAAELCSESCSEAAKNDWEWSTRLEGWGTRLGMQFDEYKLQERDQARSLFGTNVNAKKSSFDFESDFTAVLAQPSVNRVLVFSSSASLDTSKAVSEQAPKRYFGTYECKGTKVFSAEDETSYSGTVLDGNV